MSLATNIVFGLVVVWIVFYLTVYMFLLSSDDDADTSLTAPVAGLSEHLVGHTGSFTVDSFVSHVCLARDFSSGSKFGASIIIVARNEAKENLLNTINSVLTYSGSAVKSIIVVDDNSLYPVSSWPEWTSFKNIHIERTAHRIGVAAAKAFGAQLAIAGSHSTDAEKHMIVFLDSHSVVSENWLLPLAATLNAHPNSIVYPSIDVIDTTNHKLIHSSNVVGGFDWSLRFQWEDVSSHELAASRLGFDASRAVQPDTACTSPAAPGIFAITEAYYHDIGGIDTNLKFWGMENIELSLRIWMCGGTVIRQPCSRVAHSYYNLHTDTYAGGGEVTVGEVDRNAMLIAEHWLDHRSKHLVFMKRFINRIEYKVDVTLDARSPSVFYGKNKITTATCQSFDWYLDQIYPGLKVDALKVEAEYRQHLVTNYESDSISALLKQYAGESTFPIDEAEVDKLIRRANTAEELKVRQAHAKLEPAQPTRKKVVLNIDELPATDEHEKHANMIRRTMVCEDEPAMGGVDCAERKARGDCQSNKQYMMFGCPRTCGLCSADGMMCTNFFEKKCLDWKQDNQCVEDPLAMKRACRLACGFCAQSAEPINAAPKAQPETKHKLSLSLGAPAANIDPSIPNAPTDIQYTAQKAFAAGQLPDPLPEKGACSLNDLPNGQLLARVQLSSDANAAGPRVFCGIYTMEKNHATNVKATVSTWGKRCHGFLAFSTVDDYSIPAIKIEHEGEEAYDNMWQKSRSIWKYVAHNFMNDFDYFLLGGDDMFYIVENLIYYLGSDEIESQRKLGNGMFLGRRFFPPKQEVFNSGGAGYLVDKVALKLLLENLDTPKCFPHQKGFWEDVNVANCLRKSGNIVPLDTRDSLKRERFHPFTPGQHLTYRIPKGEEDWYPKYNPELKIGYDCCSDKSVSFHYCAAPILTQLHAYLYHCTSKST